MSGSVHVVYPPSVTWDAKKQRPHHLLRELARQGMIVHYIDGNPKRTTHPVCDKMRIDNMPGEFYLYGNEKAFEDHRPEGINILYAQYPHAMKWAGITNFDLIWYDYLDDFPCRRAGELEIIGSADVVTASGKYLFENASKVRSDVNYLSNGCDYVMFSRAEKVLPCPELDGIPSGTPIIGYIGAVAYWFDMPLFQYLVKSFDFAKIVLIGALFNGPNMAVKLPPTVNDNLIFLNSQPYERLPNFLSRFDVAIIPFQAESEIIRATNPIKMWEYFASGVPVVATKMPEVREFEPLIYCENDHYEFASAVNRQLKANDGLNSERQSLARERDWRVLGEKLYRLLIDGLKKKGKLAKSFKGVDKPLSESSDKKRVSLICPQFVNTSGEVASYGGAEKYYINLIKILQSRFDADVKVYQFYPPGDPKTSSQITCKPQEIDNQISVRFVEQSGYQERISRILNEEAIYNRKSDLYIYSSVRAAHNPQHPNIVIYHGVDVDFGDLRFTQQDPNTIVNIELQGYDNPEVDCYVGIDTNFSSLCKTFLNTNLDKWRYIPNSADLDKFHPRKRLQEKKENKLITILFPRFIYKARGSDIAAKCAEVLTAKYPNVKFIFCGNHFPEKKGQVDPDWTEVRKAIETNPDQIIYKKNLPFDKMADEYRSADITIIPTHYGEGTSRSAIEALASGNVVVVSWSGGLPDLMIDGFNGYVCPDRAEDFIEQLEDIIQNIDSERIKQVRKNAVATAQTMGHPQWEKKWMRLLESVLGNLGETHGK